MAFYSILYNYCQKFCSSTSTSISWYFQQKHLKKKNTYTQFRSREKCTQVGVMMGAGAAKTGLFWMREGGEGEELSLAKTDGRNVVFLIREDWEAGEMDEMHHPLIEAVDIVHYALVFVNFIVS